VTGDSGDPHALACALLILFGVAVSGCNGIYIPPSHAISADIAALRYSGSAWASARAGTVGETVNMRGVRRDRSSLDGDAAIVVRRFSSYRNVAANL
jgi:hypothetical protein